MGPKQACIDRHFLQKHDIIAGPNQPRLDNYFSVSVVQRDEIRARDFSSFRNVASTDSAFAVSLECHHLVWSESQGSMNDATLCREIVETERAERCFFWPQTDRMLFQAAAQLEERATAHRKAHRDRRYTIVGLWIAASALALNTAFKLYDRFKGEAPPSPPPAP